MPQIMLLYITMSKDIHILILEELLQHICRIIEVWFVSHLFHRKARRHENLWYRCHNLVVVRVGFKIQRRYSYSVLLHRECRVLGK